LTLIKRQQDWKQRHKSFEIQKVRIDDFAITQKLLFGFFLFAPNRKR